MPTQPLPKRNFLLLTRAPGAKEENLVGQPVCKKMAEDWHRVYFSHYDAKSLLDVVSKLWKDCDKSSNQQVFVAWRDYLVV
jgi:hypothetical protein